MRSCNMYLLRRRCLSSTVAVCILIALGCSEANQYAPPPPPKVTVAKPLRQTVTDYLEETGTTEAVQRAEVRARVRGVLQSIHFQPNEFVKQGDLLYQIEPDEYQAARDAAAAQLEMQKVALQKADLEYERQKKLRAQNATSETNLVAAEAEFKGAQAAVAAAEATLAKAQIDLDYTQVRSPIDGQVDKTLVKVGNLVGDGEATHLTTVVSIDPIYANFNISELALLKLRADMNQEQRKRGMRDDDELEQMKQSVTLYLARAIDRDFPYAGHLDNWDLTVDQSTGTYRLRGIFDNPNLDILPGLFVRIRVPLEERKDALLVPEPAVLSDQQGRYVMIVNSENVVERRNVTPGTKLGEMIVIEEGLRPDERVVVNGIQRARPLAPVTPEEMQLSPPSTKEAVERPNEGHDAEEKPPSSPDASKTAPKPE